MLSLQCYPLLRAGAHITRFHSPRHLQVAVSSCVRFSARLKHTQVPPTIPKKSKILALKDKLAKLVNIRSRKKKTEIPTNDSNFSEVDEEALERARRAANASAESTLRFQKQDKTPKNMSEISSIEPDGADIPQKPTIENLVFRGGGVKGIAYCGALKVLSDLQFLEDVKRYAGSSAGAITASLLAIGYSIPELEEILLTLDVANFKDVNGGWVAKAERLYKKFSLYEGSFFYSWISSCIAKKANAAITFKQVLEQFGKELVITGVCVSHMDVVYFSPSTHPDMCIRDAIRISMSIPMFFEPVRIDDHVYVDGGLADNFPLHVFDSVSRSDARHAAINMKTLGLFLQENKYRQAVARKIDRVQDFMGCLLDTVKLRIAELSLKQGDPGRIMFIQTHHVSSTRFDIAKDEKEMLYDEGVKAARNFVASFGLSYPKPPLWGRLIIDLKHGTGLHHHPLARNLYAVLTLGNVVKKTASTRRGKSNPKWKEIFVFPVHSEADVFKVEVFEEVLLHPRLTGNYVAKVANFKDLHCFETKIDTGKGQVILDITLSAY